jgi:hypothetical protein
MTSQPAEGGYSAVARALTELHQLDPPMDRRQVHTWNKRRTLNRAGRPFPSPVRAEHAKSRQPRLFFDIAQVVAWYAAGVPAPHGDGWLGQE